MKTLKHTILSLIILLSVLFIFSGCTEKDTNVISLPTDTGGETLTKLIGTEWKLIGFAEVGSNTMKVPEPIQDSCYLFNFDSDTTFSGITSTNHIKGEYQYDYVNHIIRVLKIGGTKIGEVADGQLYFESLRIITSFSSTENYLKLYYEDGKKYLLYKRVLK